MGVTKYTYTVGAVYGCKRLVGLSRDERNGRLMADVECVYCGEKQTMRASDLMHSRTTSCMCRVRVDKSDVSDSHTTRQDKEQQVCDSSTRLYGIWGNMKYRCNTETAQGYHNYGGKGVKVCDEWQEFIGFKKWAQSSGYDDTLTIDRIDSNGDYCPENCQWITKSENTARANIGSQHRRSDDGEYHAVDPSGNEYRFWNAAEFSREHGLNACMLRKHAKSRKPYCGWIFYH